MGLAGKDGGLREDIPVRTEEDELYMLPGTICEEFKKEKS